MNARNHRAGENPARWRGHLDKLLPKRSKVAPINHHDALPYAELPAFMQKRCRQAGIARAVDAKGNVREGGALERDAPAGFMPMCSQRSSGAS